MRIVANRGISLIQLLIVVILISVISTAIWNLRVNRTDLEFDQISSAKDENDVRLALDEIGYHLNLAGYGLSGGSEPLVIVKGEITDTLCVRHNDISFEFYIDEKGSLIKRIETVDKILAENIYSLQAVKVNPTSVAVTLSTVTMDALNDKGQETLSKSYSTVVELRSMM